MTYEMDSLINAALLKHIPTADIIAELARRDPVEVIERKSPAEGTFVKGPCTVLIIRSA